MDDDPKEDVHLRASRLITRPMLLQVASQVVNGTNCPDIANARDGIALMKAVLEFNIDPVIVSTLRTLFNQNQ